jgi:hypothetical protein
MAIAALHSLPAMSASCMTSCVHYFKWSGQQGANLVTGPDADGEQRGCRIGGLLATLLHQLLAQYTPSRLVWYAA